VTTTRCGILERASARIGRSTALGLGYHQRMSTSDKWNEIEPGRYQHADRPEVFIEACQVTENRRRHGETTSESYEGWGLVIDGKPEASYRTLAGAKRAATHWAML